MFSPRRISARRFAAGFCLSLIPTILMGCANGGLSRLETFKGPLESGDPQARLQAVRAKKDLYGKEAEFLRELDLGVLHQYANNWDSSIVHLAAADQVLDNLYARSVTNEAASLAVNDNFRPYRSRPYERLLLSQFQLMGYLGKNDLEGAVVEARSGLLKINKLAEDGTETLRNQAMLEYLHSLVYQAAGERDNSLISLERAVRAWNRGTIPAPELVRQSAAYRLQKEGRSSSLKELGLEGVKPSAEVSALENSPSEIVVLVLRGRTPVIDQMRFWGGWMQNGGFSYYYRDPISNEKVVDVLAIAAPGSVTGRTFSVNFTMPVYKPVPSRVQSVVVQAPTASQGPAVLANTGYLLEKALKDEYTSTLTRTIFRVATRTIAAQKTKSALATGNPLIDLVANVGLDVAQGEVEQADVRLCLWMPLEFSVVRIPVQPGTHAVKALAQDGAGKVIGEKVFGDVTVAAGKKRFVIASFPY